MIFQQKLQPSKEYNTSDSYVYSFARSIDCEVDPKEKNRSISSCRGAIEAMCLSIDFVNIVDSTKPIYKNPSRDQL